MYVCGHKICTEQKEIYLIYLLMIELYYIYIINYSVMLYECMNLYECMMLYAYYVYCSDEQHYSKNFVLDVGRYFSLLRWVQRVGSD